MRYIGIMNKKEAMRKMWMLILVADALLGTGACGRSSVSDFDGQQAFRYAEEQMAFGPRIPGSESHTMTGDWILELLKDDGFEIEEQVFLYKGKVIRNLIGRWKRGRSEQPVLIGAHYDTRPQADRDDKVPFKPVPGANDGASGVAVLLELARIIAANGYDREIWLVFFDAEDSGGIEGWEWIVGSTYFVDHLQVAPASVVIVDMVGDRGLNLYYERHSSPDLAAKLWGIAGNLGYEAFIEEEKHALLDDHSPFLDRGFQAVDIIDFDYEYWHTTEDTIDKISPQSLEQVGRTVQMWIESLP
jgi:glutaminyl-peptide cyclotransferase